MGGMVGGRLVPRVRRSGACSGAELTKIGRLLASLPTWSIVEKGCGAMSGTWTKFF
jgi:hypothetical protein